MFFISNNVNVNIDLLKNKLINSGFIEPGTRFELDDLKQLLINRFESIDYKEACEDVKPFITNIDILKYWNKEMFINTINKLKKAN